MKTFVRVILVMCAVACGNVIAAYTDAIICNDPDGTCGYYLPYEGRTAGFLETSLSITGEVLKMSIDPTIYAHSDGLVRTYNYAAVHSPDSGFTADEQIMYDRMAYVFSDIASMDDKTLGEREVLGATLNIAVWNIWADAHATDPVPFPESGSPLRYAIHYYNSAMGMNGWDWSQTGIKLMIPQGSGPQDQFLVYTSTVPVLPAVWLFGSGLIGLLGAARRKSS